MSPDEPDPLRLRTIPTDRSPSPRRATWIVLLVVLVTGSAAAAVAWRIADVAAEDKRSEAVESVLRSIERDTDDLVVAMSGTSALVQADGTITQGALDRYATDLAAVGQARPLVWMTPVAADSWEIRLAAVGRGPDPRPDDDAAALDGLEAGRVLGADSPLAAAANSARELGRPTLARVDSGRGARLVVLKPLYLIGDGEPEFIGVAASADLPGQLPSRVATDVPADVRFRVADGDTVLAVSDPPPTAGVTTDVAVAGRILSVQVEDARPVNHDLSWFLLWIMAVIVAAAGVVGLRSARYDQDRRLTNATISRTAALAQRLARAATVDEVADVIGDHVPALLGADVASFGEVDGDVVRLHHRSGTDPAVAELTELPLDGIPSLVREVDAGHTVLLRDPQEWRRAMPGGIADRFLDAGARVAAVLPLEAPGRGVVATIGILWWRPPELDERTTATLDTVRELCEQSLSRAALTDRVSERASALADLAERLAGADTVVEVARTATSGAARVVGARTVDIGVTDVDRGVMRLHRDPRALGPDEPVVSELGLDADTAQTAAARTGAPDLQPRPVEDPDGSPAGARAAFPLRADERVVGAICWSWDRPVAFDPDTVNELTTVAEITAQSIRRAQLIEDQAADARRNRALAELAQGLAARSETEDIAGFLTESVMRPLGAAYSVVGVIDGDRIVRRYSESLVRTGLTALGQDQRSVGIGSPTPDAEAARTASAVVVTDRTQADDRYPTMIGVWDQLGVQSGAAVPVKDRNGRVVAVISVLWDHPTVIRPDVSDTLATVAGMVGQTLERTGLVDELRRSVLRNQRLADFARLLADVRSVDEIRKRVRSDGAAPVGADVIDMVLLADGRSVAGPERTDGPGLLTDGTGASSTTLVEPARECLRQREMVTLGASAIRARLPTSTVEELSSTGIVLVAYLPLVAPDGAELGVVALGWPGPPDLTPTVVAKLRTVAELCSQALQRTRLREAEHRLVVSLQERVVHPVPDAPGLLIAQRYLPAAEQVGMGGDWFEGVELGAGRFAVIIGDIAGHGINAVADMVELRAIIGSMLRSGTPLEEVYPRVAALVQQGGRGLTATSCTAVFDTSDDTVRYVSAGHLPPVLTRPDGSVELLEQGRQPLLGVAGSIVAPGVAPFGPGSSLVLYTDGIVERRREPIDVSIENLRVATTELVRTHLHRGTEVTTPTQDDVERFTDALLRSCLGERSTDDDVALVVVTRADRIAPGR
ncbi:MAG TPA: SpoIIE family protein phosphatase [Microthrixaceae bacterium]|nr:SpoIIE family protein phosphatase [Microthrixaceae bacterium]